jgi:hypothetical protein
MKSILTSIATSSLLAGLVITTLAGSANAGDSVYVVNFFPPTGVGEFGIVDLSTGAFQQIGTTTEPDGYDGLAWVWDVGVPRSPGGRSLVSLTEAGNLDAINPATGVPRLIGPTGLTSCVIPTQLSCGPKSAFTLGAFNGTIYATDYRNDLYVVDPITGRAALLSDHTGLPASPFILGSQNSDGTFNYADEAIWEADGKLYLIYDAFVIDLSTNTVVRIVVAPELYQIDPATGRATVIGPISGLTHNLGINGGVKVNGASYVFTAPRFGLQIATIDLSTGKTHPIGALESSAGRIEGAVPVYPR